MYHVPGTGYQGAGNVDFQLCWKSWIY